MFLATSQLLHAQQNDQELKALILEKDSLFWQAYNHCDIEKMMSYFDPGVEFYHDKGGITLGTADVAKSFKDGVCSHTDSFRLRREPMPATCKVFPMRKAGIIYGAVLSGDHLFYVQEKGKKERAEGLARFTHLWLLKDGLWKMTRVVSYDHGPAPYINQRTVTVLPASVLKSYAGSYKGPQTTEMVIKPEKAILLMEIGGKRFELYPEKEGFFFSKERDLTFEFLRGGKLVIRERDEVAEELEVIRR